MSKPLLSICIATYNRANFIGETLNSIIPQLTTEVEVVIADGASMDNTSTVVKQFAATHSQLRYVQLPSKGGVDQDYCKVVELAEADMCWLFTDDDLIKPGAVQKVLREVSKGYSLIVANAEVKNLNFSKFIHKRQMKIEEDKIFNSSELNGLFQCVIPYLSFIGGTIINRKLWLKRNKEAYFGTEFIHVGVIFQEPLPGKTLVISEPLITIRLGNAQWTQRSFQIWIIKWPKLLCSFQHISETCKKEYSVKPSLKKLANLIHQRSECAFSQNEFRLWLNTFNDAPGWWKFAVKTVSLVPLPAARAVISIYLGLKNR